MYHSQKNQGTHTGGHDVTINKDLPLIMKISIFGFVWLDVVVTEWLKEECLKLGTGSFLDHLL